MMSLLSTTRLCGVLKLPGCAPRSPHALTKLPSLSNFATRELPYPSATNILDAPPSCGANCESRQLLSCLAHCEADYLRGRENVPDSLDSLACILRKRLDIAGHARRWRRRAVSQNWTPIWTKRHGLSFVRARTRRWGARSLPGANGAVSKHPMGRVRPPDVKQVGYIHGIGLASFRDGCFIVWVRARLV